jgi:carboxylesterase
MKSNIDETAALFAAQFHDPIHQSFFVAGQNGAAALFVHGFPGTPAEVRPLADVFAREGWTVRGELLPGFGSDLTTLARRTQREWAATVEAALRDLTRQYSTVIAVGNSMGGALTIAAAAHIRLNGLILISPFWKLENPLWHALPVLKYAIPNFKPFSLVKVDFNDPEVRASMRNFMPDVDLDDPAVQRGVRDFAIPTGMLNEVRTAGRIAGDAARHVHAPALILQGTADTLVTPAATRVLAAKFPNAALHELDGGHDLLTAHLPAFAHIERLTLTFANRINTEQNAAQKTQ